MFGTQCPAQGIEEPGDEQLLAVGENIQEGVIRVCPALHGRSGSCRRCNILKQNAPCLFGESHLLRQGRQNILHVTLQRTEQVRRDELQQPSCVKEFHQLLMLKMRSHKPGTVLTVRYGGEHVTCHRGSVILSFQGAVHPSYTRATGQYRIVSEV